jgi:hypothetical protein
MMYCCPDARTTAYTRDIEFEHRLAKTKSQPMSTFCDEQRTSSMDGCHIWSPSSPRWISAQLLKLAQVHLQARAVDPPSSRNSGAAKRDLPETRSKVACFTLPRPAQPKRVHKAKREVLKVQTS